MPARLAGLLWLVACAACACPAPTMRLILGYPPGGASDTVARLLVPELASRLGLAVTVVHVPGVGGAQAAREVAEATPDGCTLFLGTLSTHALLPATARNLKYDPMMSFTAIAMVAAAPLIVAVHPNLPVANVNELIRYARMRPGQLRYGSAGVGTASHLAATMFARMTNVRMEHVPYEGSAPMIADLVAGRLQLAFDNAVAQAARQGRLRALAVTSQTRLSSLPNVPTLSEAGVPGFEATTWFGLYGPHGLDETFTARIAEAVSGILAHESLRQTYAQHGLQIRYLGPAQFAAFTHAEVLRWAKETEQAFVLGK